MTPTAWLLLAAILVLDTGSHLCLKAASTASLQPNRPPILALLSQPLLWLAVVSFVLLFIVWIGFISLVPLSQGVMAGSITIVGVMIGGRICFGEHLTLARTGAVALISLGVLLVGLGA